MSFRVALIALGAVALAGCNTMYTHIGDEDPGIGEAVAYDAAGQTINPAPVYGAEGAKPGDNGQLGAAAVARYRADKVKQPVRQSSSSGSGEGSSSGGGPR